MDEKQYIESIIVGDIEYSFIAEEADSLSDEFYSSPEFEKMKAYIFDYLVANGKLQRKTQ
nr:MAG TPA: Single-stranded DNA-binding protein 2 single strand DNA binding.52A [Caudoviricetes sp.]